MDLWGFRSFPIWIWFSEYVNETEEEGTNDPKLFNEENSSIKKNTRKTQHAESNSGGSWLNLILLP